MPNEELISALRNAIDHGESLQSAVQIMINSGYNSKEVMEASKFIGGTLSMQELTPEEQLAMPEEGNSLSSRFKFWAKNKKQNQTAQIMQPLQIQKQPLQQIPLQYPEQMQQLSQYPQQPRQQTIPQQSFPQPPQQQIQQQTNQLPQYSQQITQSQIKQSFQQPFQQYPQQIQKPLQQLQQQKQQTIPQQSFQQPPQQQIPKQAPRPSPQIIARHGPLSREIKKIKPVKQGYMKEIILLIILLILIGILAAIIFFKDKILAWFA
jgi:hypothetical protein